MQKRLGACAIVLAMGGSNVAAAAQGLMPLGQAAPTAVSLEAILPKVEPPPAPLSYFWRVKLAPGVELSHQWTPSSRQLRLSLSEFWDGRLQVGCFQRIRPMNWSFVVPALSTSFGANSVTPALSHDLSYGIGLRFRFFRRGRPDD